MIRLISSMVVLLTFCAKITCAGEPTRIDALLRGTGWNQVADGLFENRNITLGQLRKEIGEKFQFQLIHAGFSGEALWEVPQGSFIITPLEFDGLRVSDNTHVVANYFSSNLKNNQQLESFKILEKELIAKGYVKDLTHPDNLLSLSGSLAQLEKDMGFVLLLSQDSKYFFGRKGAICAGFWPINPQEEKKLNGRLYITWGPPAAPNRISFDKQKLVDAGFSLTRGILTHNRTANDIINDLEIEMDRIQKSDGTGYQFEISDLIKGVIFGVGGKIEEPLPHNVPLRVDLGFEVLEVNDKSKALWDRLISKGYGIRYASFEAKGHAQTLLKKLGVEMNVKALEEYGPYKFGDAAVYISRVDGSADSEVKQVVVKFRPAESYAVLSQGLRADGFEMKEDGSLECKDVKMGDLIRKLGHAFFIKNYWQSRETDGKRYFVYNDSEYSAVVSPLDNPGVLPELSQRVAVRVFQFFPSGQDGLSKAVK